MSNNKKNKMTKIPADPLSQDLKIIMEKTLEESHEIILKELREVYKFSEIKASEILKNVDTYTISTMIKTFSYNYVGTDNIGKFDKYEREPRNYRDVAQWSWTVLTIPFYQSLGDTIGYYNGRWEFNNGEKNAGPEYTNDLIYEFISLGGINDLSIKNWLSSDDTIMYMATMEVLLEGISDPKEFGKKLRVAYLDIKPLIKNRHPGIRTMESLESQENIKWDQLIYNSKAIGNGSVMRCGCIGIFFPGEHNREKLISLAVESSRITHNSAIAILGSITAALFTAYSIERVPINMWPHELLKILKVDANNNFIDRYMKASRPKEYPLFARDKILYVGQWQKYVDFRFSGIKPLMDIPFMNHLVLRYKYLSEKFSKSCDMPGGCADDCVIMAYDALLQSEGIFEKVVIYSILHPGDSDTVGSVALSWFGGYYHTMRYEMLFGHYFEELEFHDKLYAFVEKGIPKMVKIYYSDIYLNIARKYLRERFLE